MAITGALGGVIESAAGTEAGGTGTWLPDQDFYNQFIRPEEQRLLQSSMQRAQATSRAGRAKQSGFLTAQGLGDTTIAGANERGLSGAFRRALQRSADTARMQGEALRRQKFAARDQERGASLARISTAAGLEGSISSAILGSNPVTAGFAPLASGLSAGGGIIGSLATSELPNRIAEDKGYGNTLDTVNYDANALFDGGADSALLRTRGGGGQDFLRTFG